MSNHRSPRVKRPSPSKESRYDVLLMPPGSTYYIPYWLQRRSPQWESMIPKGLSDRRWRNTYYASLIEVDSDKFVEEFSKVFKENVAARGLIGDELQSVVDDGTAFVDEILDTLDDWSVETLEDARSVIEDSTYEWASEAHRAFDVALDSPSVICQDES